MANSRNLSHLLALAWKRRLTASREEVPSARELADLEGVAIGTARRVLLLLRQWGVVDWNPGRRPRRAEREVTSLMPTLDSSARVGAGSFMPSEAIVAEKLRKAMAQGVYRTGDPFPKFRILQEREKVGRSTLCAAMRRLEKDGLAHKNGRNWFVGPAAPPIKAGVRAYPERPVILVLSSDYRHWQSICSSERTRDFAVGFLQECRKFGMVTLQVTTEVGAEALLPSGEEAIRQNLLGLGNRYVGALIPSSFIEFPDWARWARWLARFGKPVVKFDRLNTDGSLPAGAEKLSERFYRLHYDEDAALRLALLSLWNHGHKVVVYPNTMPRSGEWIREREAGLTRAALQLKLPMQLISVERTSPPQGAPPQSHPPTSRKPFSQAEMFERRVRSADEFMSSVIRVPGRTAILAPHDNAAELAYAWLRAKGFRLPEDISLLSFDNSVRGQVFPFSTIDFGFDYLGYAAFHLLSGYLPIKSGKDGSVGARPFLVDRGSLGPC